MTQISRDDPKCWSITITTASPLTSRHIYQKRLSDISDFVTPAARQKGHATYPKIVKMKGTNLDKLRAATTAGPSETLRQYFVLSLHCFRSPYESDVILP